MIHTHATEEARAQAALYAMGALSPAEAQAFERHLAEGCLFCADEAATFASVTQELGYAAPLHTPRPELRSRVLEQAAVQGTSPAHPTIDKELLRFVGSSWLAWSPGNIPGVDIKVLSVDKERQYYTTLVRMAPGASLAPHRHIDVEESYILEGELLLSGVLMRQGDYCRAEVGSLHTGVTSKTGCVFIAVASSRDEWFA